MDFREQLSKLDGLDLSGLFNEDFLLTWDKSEDEIRGVLAVADALRALRESNKSARIFDSGLGISLFRDNSTRTRFSFASAVNLLGLEADGLRRGQVPGRPRRDGPRDREHDLLHGRCRRHPRRHVHRQGPPYMAEFAQYVKEGHAAGVLEQRPTLVNLQCDIDHPTQSTADLLHLIHEFGGLENLRGKKLAMTWAYSPSAMASRLGAPGHDRPDDPVRHGCHPRPPAGYDVMELTRDVASRNAAASGGSFRVTNSMEDAFEGADIVCPSWAPYAAMEERTELYGNGDSDGIKALEKRLLAQNAEHQDWTTTEEMMARTKDGKALYMHRCRPISPGPAAPTASRDLGLRPVPRPDAQAGEQQALLDRVDDLPSEGQGPGRQARGAVEPPPASLAGLTVYRRRRHRRPHDEMTARPPHDH